MFGRRELEEEIKKLKSENWDLKCANNKYSSDNFKLNSRIDSLVQELNELKEQKGFNELKEKIKEQENELETIKEENNKLQQKNEMVDNLKREILIKNNEIEIYKQAIKNASLILNKKEEETKKQIKPKKENK